LSIIVAQKLVEASRIIHANPDSNGFGGLDRFGHVGCWIYVPSIDQWFWGQSVKLATGKYDHAERAAIKKVLDFLGVRKLPKGCVVISTLEPCSGPVKFRNGCSCSKLLKQHGVDTVHVGVRDWIQRDFVTGAWPVHSFKMVMTTDPEAVVESKRLFSYLETWILANKPEVRKFYDQWVNPLPMAP